jgi:hypothetical protein
MEITMFALKVAADPLEEFLKDIEEILREGDEAAMVAKFESTDDAEIVGAPSEWEMYNGL